MGKVLRYRFRAIGAALALVVAALACVVLFVPIAAGGSPSGKDQVKRYASVKSGAPLKIVSRGDIFVIQGANFGDASAEKVGEVDCLDLDKSSPTYTEWVEIADWGDIDGAITVDSKHIEAMIGDDPTTNGCISNDPRERLRVRFTAPTDDLNSEGFVDVIGPRLVIKGTPTAVQ